MRKSLKLFEKLDFDQKKVFKMESEKKLELTKNIIKEQQA